MTRSISSPMDLEICESADVVSRIVLNRHAVAEVARRLDIRRRAALCSVRPRELRSRRCLPALPHRNAASPAGVRQRSLGDHGISQAADVTQCTLHRDLAIGSQPRSGRCKTVRARVGCAHCRDRQRGAVAGCRSPTPPSSSFRSKRGLNIRSPQPRPWSARWPLVPELIAELAGDMALRSAFDRLPDRLHRALTLDWSEISEDLASASAVFVATSRGLGLSSAREVALKRAEILRLPALSFSSAELQHGPRAALSSKTPVIIVRLKDETAATVDAVARELRERKIVLHLCGGPLSTLPWLGDDDPATDGITMLVPAYRIIERTAREWGFDPDRPPQLSKVIETF